MCVKGRRNCYHFRRVFKFQFEKCWIASQRLFIFYSYRCNEDLLKYLFSFRGGFEKNIHHSLQTAINQKIKFLLLCCSSKTNGSCSEEETYKLCASFVLQLENKNPTESREQSEVSTLEDDISGKEDLLLDVTHRKRIIMKIIFIHYHT